MIRRAVRVQPQLGRSRRAPFALVLLALFAWAGGHPAIASGQSLDANLWVTDGEVDVIVPWGNTIYIGGSFGYVGPNTGGWTEVGGSGSATSLLPRLDGDVTAIVTDGAGGWFIGGTFTHVAGIAHQLLAHVLADGSVAPWTPNPVPSASPTCLEHSASRVFVATDANELKAYDDATGAAIGGWAPEIFGPVSSMAVNGSTLFVAGALTFQVTGSSQFGSGIAAVNTSTGAIEAWDPAPQNGDVARIRVDGRWLYVTGGFDNVGGQAHGGLARALLSTKVFDSNWNPSVDSPVQGMATASSGFWIGGEFFLVNGQFVDRFAVLDTTTGVSLGVQADLTGIEGAVSAMVVSGTNVYLGISPTFAVQLGGSAKPLVVRVSVTGGKPDRFLVLGEGRPTGDVAAVRSLKLSSGGLVVAGRFISAGGRSQVAVAALDRNTGAARTWDPKLSVDEAFPIVPSVSAILPTNHAIYIGGYFTHAGGAARKSLAAIDSASGFARAWQADLAPALSTQAGSAAALALFGDKLVVGGHFNAISGVSHASLASVDTVVGTPLAGWSADVSGAVKCLLVRGSTLFVGGGLSSVGGQSRANVAALNGSTGAVLAWNPGIQGVSADALGSRGDTLYIGGDYAFQTGGTNRSCLAAVSATSGSFFAWAPVAFGPVRALTIDGPWIIVGGEFQFIVSQPQPFLAKLDRFTAALGAGTAVSDAEVFALAGDATSLYVGGRFGGLASSPTANLGRASGPDGAGPAIVVIAANGGETLVIGTTYRFEYTAGDLSGVASVDVELSRAGSGGPWVTLASGLRNTGHFEWPVTGPAVAAGAWLRVSARDFAGNLGSDLSNAAFSISGPVASVDPARALESFSLGPNPARLQTQVRFSLRGPTRATIRLMDVQGRQVWGRPEQSYAAGQHAMPCEVSSLRPGLYFLRLEHSGGSRVTRLAVCR